MKQYLDIGMSGVFDNWWDVVRQQVDNYEQFKSVFKNKYWSEAVQHQVRTDIESGRYDPNRGMTPTSYFWSKISVARYLEPPIQEEILCTKLCFHFDENIRRARLSAQVKTIAVMENLLSDYENEEYYRKRRFQFDRAESDNRPKKVNFMQKNKEKNDRGNYKWKPYNKFYKNYRTDWKPKEDSEEEPRQDRNNGNQLDTDVSNQPNELQN